MRTFIDLKEASKMKKLANLAAVIAAFGLTLGALTSCDGNVKISDGTRYDADGEWFQDAFLALAGISDWTAIDVDDEDCFWYGDDDDGDTTREKATSFSFWSSTNYSTDEVKALKGIAIVYYVSSDAATEYEHDDGDTYADNWVTIANSDWTYSVEAGARGEAGYYALVVDDTGARVAGVTDSWASYWSVPGGSISELISDGEIVMQGEYVTVLGAYYNY